MYSNRLINISGKGSTSSASGSTVSSTQNKMRIRSFPLTMDEKYIAQIWDLLKRAIKEIQRKNNSGLSFEELYRNAYTMVLHKHGEKLYNGLKEVVTEHLRENVRPRVLEANDIGFLDVLNSVWQDHSTSMVMIRDILMYMDRVYVQQQNVEPVFGLGLKLFRDEIIRFGRVGETLRNILLKMINAERNGEVINRMAIRSACEMLLALGVNSRSVYEDEFEANFLQTSAEYYRLLSQEFLTENSAPMYIKKVEDCILDESRRADFYLDKKTEAKILQVIDDELITKHVKMVVEMEGSGVVYMLENNRINDLNRLYRLFKRVSSGLPAVTQCISAHVQAQGLALVRELEEAEGTPKNPVQFIQAMLDLKDRCDHFMKESFDDDQLFKRKTQSDFEYFLNQSQRAPEYLSMFIDDKLKKAGRMLSEHDQEMVQEKIMVLFRFLKEKDVFERYYKIHLTKRLLSQKSASDDAEKGMIARLKTECGSHYTIKLESMLKDIERSTELFNTFKDRGGNQFGFDFSIKVLTSGCWPTQSGPTCILPQVVSSVFEDYQRYYLDRFSGRKLWLNPLLGSADLKATFYGPAVISEELSQQESESQASSNAVAAIGASVAQRARESVKILTVNTFQMCILLRFNNKARLTFQELQNMTAIPDKELKRALTALALGKPTQKILLRKGSGAEIENTDEFWVDDSFTSKAVKIKIQSVALKPEAEPERKETRQKIEEGRRHEIDAAIVRILKARKSINHASLINEVTQLLEHRFQPKSNIIKQRIEILIERDYISRSSGEMSIYNYVA